MPCPCDPNPYALNNETGNQPPTKPRARDNGSSSSTQLNVRANTRLKAIAILPTATQTLDRQPVAAAE
jgi:hypothetical protein